MSVLVTHVKMVAPVLTKWQAMDVTALLVSMKVTAKTVSLLELCLHGTDNAIGFMSIVCQ